MNGGENADLPGNKLRIALFVVFGVFVLIFVLVLISKSHSSLLNDNSALRTCNLDSNCKTGERCINKKCILSFNITLLKPLGGEELAEKHPYRISWIASSNVKTLDISLLSSLGTETKIASNISAEEGFYMWTPIIRNSEEKYKILLQNNDGTAEKYLSNDWFTISSGSNSLPRLDSVAISSGLPGNEVIITGAGFNKKEDNLIIFKFVSSPFSFYNGKAGAEYKLGVLPKSVDGKTIQFSVPFRIYSLPKFTSESSSAIPIIPGKYELFVANNTQDYDALGLDGITLSNGIMFEIQNPAIATKYPTKINLTSPKGGDIWKAGEMRRISWEDLSLIPKLDIYAYTDYYRFDETHAGFYFQRIKLGLSESLRKFDWKVNLNESVTYNYSSPQEIYNISWLPEDGKLRTYLLVQGSNANGLVYKDVSGNFTIITPLVGSCNRCPGEISECFEGGYRSCQKINGCWKWSPVTNCKSTEKCINGMCLKE